MRNELGGMTSEEGGMRSDGRVVRGMSKLFEACIVRFRKFLVSIVSSSQPSQLKPHRLKRCIDFGGFFLCPGDDPRILAASALG